MKKRNKIGFSNGLENKNTDKFTHLAGFENLNYCISAFQAFFRAKIAIL